MHQIITFLFEYLTDSVPAKQCTVVNHHNMPVTTTVHHDLAM